MRSGPDQRPRGRYNGNRPFRQQPGAPPRNQTSDSNGPSVRIRSSAYQRAEHYFRLAGAIREGNQQGIGTPPQPAALTEAVTNGPCAKARRHGRRPPGTRLGHDRPGFL
jgi:hypothetical protein